MTLDDLDWKPAAEAPNEDFQALVKLPDGSVAMAFRANYYIWNWSVAVRANGFQHADYWSTSSMAEPTHYYRLPEGKKS